MLTYAPVSEAGGVGKTTTAATLAASHARAGHDVLAIDMDTQNGSLTYFFGPDYDRGDPNVDNLVRHLVGRPKGEFHDLAIEVEEGIDLIPSHNMLEDLHEFLLNEKIRLRISGSHTVCTTNSTESSVKQMSEISMTSLSSTLLARLVQFCTMH